MPKGFVGNVTQRYLTDVEEALNAAAPIHSRDPLIGVPTRLTGRPALPSRINVNPPHPASTAHSGGNNVGAGTSSNVVVSQDLYKQLMQQVDLTDDRIGEALYKASTVLEEMCNTSYILPTTLPRFLAISDAVKSTLNEFRTVTADGGIKVTHFAINTIDLEPLGADRFVFQDTLAERVRYESDQAFRQQINNMQDTISSYNSIVSGLEERWSHEDHIARTAMRWRPSRNGGSWVPDTVRRMVARARANELRAQINAINGATVEITAAISELERAKLRTNVYFMRMREATQHIDNKYAHQVQDVTGYMQAYADKMQKLSDSIDELFADSINYASNLRGLMALLQSVIASSILDERIAAKLAGIPLVCAFSGDPVNMSTGNFIYSKEDISVPGRFPLSFKRFYNAIGGANSVLGANWTHNFNIKLSVEEKFVFVMLDDGRIDTYEEVDKGIYFSITNKNTLTKTEDGWNLLHTSKEQWTFSKNGEILKISDANGNTTEFTYTDGLLTKASNCSGYFSFSYNADNHIISVIDQVSRKVEFEYEDNQLVKVIHPSKASYQYRYDEKGRFEELINPLGVTAIRNEYDEDNRTSKQYMADDGIMEYLYDDNNKTTIFVQQNGSKISYQRDEKYRTTAIVYPDGRQSRVYDDKDQVISQVDKNGNTTKFSYDKLGNVSQVIDPLGHKTSFVYDEYKLTSVSCEDYILATMSYDSAGNPLEVEDALGRKGRLLYDELGKPIKVIAPDDSVTIAKYDERGNITKITDALGATTQYEYNALNQVVKVTKPEGNIMSFAYNASGDIEKTVDAEGNTRYYEYNLSGKVTKIVDWDGSEVTFSYNDLGKVEQIVDQLGGTTSYEYDKMWNVISVTDPCGNKVRYAYDDLGRVKETTDKEGNTTSYEHDPNGNVVAVISPLGAKTEVKYDALDRQEEVTSPDGSVTKITYDRFNNVTEVTDALGNVMKREYDRANQLVGITDALGNKTILTYTALGQVETVTNPKGESISYIYYPGGKLKSTLFASGTIESYEYDKNGNVIKTIDGLGNETIMRYDSLDRMVEVINPLGYSKKFAYDALGNITQTTDENGDVTKCKYSLLGDIIEVIDASGHSTKYEYDATRKLTKLEQYRLINGVALGVKVPEYQITTYERDKNGNVIAVHTPLGAVSKFSYNAEGRVISKLDEDNQKTLYEYNLLGSLSKVSYADGKTVAFSYNALQQLTEMQDWLGTTKIEVDALGRTTKVTDFENNEVGYVWNSASQRTKTIYPDNSEVNYEYTAAGKLAKVTSKAGVTSYNYDALHRLTERILPDNTISKYARDPLGRLSELVHSKNDNILDCFKYTYDAVNNITQIEKQRAGIEADSGLFEYAYDKMGRLTTASHKDATKHYAYDELGNRLKSWQNNDKNAVLHEYNALNQLISSRDGDATREYSYDLRGNLTKITENEQITQSFTFDATNMMTGAFTKGKGNAEYTYNGFRNRASKIEQLPDTSTPDPMQEVRYILDMTLPYDNLLMTQGAQNQSFIWGNGLISANGTNSEDSFHYLQDHLGSPIRLLGDENLNMPLAYDEFGVPKVEAGQNINGLNNPFGFTGYQIDNITGLNFAQARYYAPHLGRFGAEDPIKDGLNWYEYCHSNPVNYVDKNGLWPESVHKGEVGSDFGTITWAMEMGITQSFAEQIGRATYAVDTNIFTNPLIGNSWHFNTNISILGIPDSRQLHVERNFNNAVYHGTRAVALVNSGNNSPGVEIGIDLHMNRAMTALGRALHPLQDIHAHGQIGAGHPIVSQHLFDWSFSGDNRWFADDIEFDWADPGIYRRLIRTGERQRLAATEEATLELLTRFLLETGLYGMSGFHTSQSDDECGGSTFSSDGVSLVGPAGRGWDRIRWGR